MDKITVCSFYKFSEINDLKNLKNKFFLFLKEKKFMELF